ncbi:DNA-binding transcriptional regulator, Lrp family [Halalkaliarchaeum sp. AArc-CO]|uniref:Lrp/AsnC family transcriptional regulator n=1 Tax=Halalkaliarchaeum sp. AArc-CO TaxID=2866381 RepID=UPI00217DEA68|nr:TrkA C-terminal domain-containing protein [Halalkaliarchaeum sp. AArc-CO]UWG52195.1 DNA-binding transcriptional regulator, Lrp family [Halalkaliarchaeum sp. AArc-CO]
MPRDTQNDYRLDRIDRRTIYALMQDARNTSAPAIAETVNVSAGTIRNRIENLENHGVVRGYTAQVDFERAEGLSTSLFVCSAPVSKLEVLALEVRAIPGVIHVRELLSGDQNLHVTAVSEDSDDRERIMAELTDLGLEIEADQIVRNEAFEPYAPYGPEDEGSAWSPTDVISLAGGAEVVEVSVSASAPVVDLSLAEANEREILEEEVLVITIERDGSTITPRGETVVQQGDVVTLLARGGDPEQVLEAFHGDEQSIQSNDDGA